jgi:2-keto-3-deoxy-L-rhamnonate aldolase RhmA
MESPVIPPNRLKAALREGRPATGTMIVECRQPSLMQVLANAGFDFAIIDNEHGPFTIESIAALSQSGRAHGVTPIVRVPEISYTHITQALDAGAQGLMIPRITEPHQVAEVVQMMKYPPIGRRGSVMGRAHMNFRSGSVETLMEQMNRETMLIVQIETVEALEGREDIIAVPGVDAALVGPNDLSIAMGIPGQLDNPAFVKAVESVIVSCTNAGVIPALHVNELDKALFWASKGMRMVSINSELGHLGRSAREATVSLTKAFRV